MKKRSVNQGMRANDVTGLWARELPDGTYALRYANNKVARIWEYACKDGAETWAVVADRRAYRDMVHDMRQSGMREIDADVVSDDAHGWFLIPESEWETVGVGFDEDAGEMTVNMPNRMIAATSVAMLDVPDDADESEDVDAFVGWRSLPDHSYTTAMVEPEAVTRELPRVMADADAEAGTVVSTSANVVEVTIPELVAAREFEPLQGLGKVKWFRTAKGRKVVYVACDGTRCVVAWRANRYERGTDKTLEKQLADYLARRGFRPAA